MSIPRYKRFMKRALQRSMHCPRWPGEDSRAGPVRHPLHAQAARPRLLRRLARAVLARDGHRCRARGKSGKQKRALAVHPRRPDVWELAWTNCPGRVNYERTSAMAGREFRRHVSQIALKREKEPHHRYRWWVSLLSLVHQYRKVMLSVYVPY